MSDYQQRLDFIIRYAGSDAGNAEREKLLTEIKSLQSQREELRKASKRVLEQYAADGGYGATLAFEDAMRVLESAYYAPTSPQSNSGEPDGGQRT